MGRQGKDLSKMQRIVVSTLRRAVMADEARRQTWAISQRPTRAAWLEGG